MAQSFDIKSLRDRLGWSQDQVADYLGINRSNVSRMESGGTIRGPNLRLLTALAKAADEGTADALLQQQQAAE